MDTFFLDNFINERELNHLAKEVKRKQLDKTINAINKLNNMQTEIIEEKNLTRTQYLKKRLTETNGRKYF